jgi:hypothetical protein
MRNRLTIATLAGAILGIACIVGIGFRLGFEGNGLFLFSAWYNRVIMGLLIGLAGSITLLKKDLANSLLRGTVLGFIVSLSWYVASDVRDTVGFLAGIGYGIVIDFLATKYSK